MPVHLTVRATAEAASGQPAEVAGATEDQATAEAAPAQPAEVAGATEDQVRGTPGRLTQTGRGTPVSSPTLRT